MIPSDTNKPHDPRSKDIMSDGLTSNLISIMSDEVLPLPYEDPDSILDIIRSESVYLLTAGKLAFLRGDLKKAIQYYRQIHDIPSKLRSYPLLIVFAISSGDHNLFDEIESICKDMLQSNDNEVVRKLIEWVLSTAYIGGFALSFIPEWLKEGDFSYLPLELRPEAICKQLRYLHYIGRYELILSISQTALNLIDTKRGIYYHTIYLQLMCAAACCMLDRTKQAEEYILKAMEVCLPHGFITPFAELLPLYGGLVERILQRDYLEYFEAVTKLSEQIISNWVEFHNRMTKNSITTILTRQEYQVALLAVKKVPYKLIATQQGVSISRIKGIINSIYTKLYINSREELREYIL